MSENYPKYEINSFMDFCKIPSDKLDHCLEDFKIFIKQVIGMKESIESFADLAKELGMLTEGEFPEGEDVVTFKKFIWIDDGKHEVTKNFHFTEKDSEDGAEPFLSITETEDGIKVSGSMIEDAGNV